MHGYLKLAGFIFADFHPAISTGHCLTEMEDVVVGRSVSVLVELESITTTQTYCYEAQ